MAWGLPVSEKRWKSTTEIWKFATAWRSLRWSCSCSSLPWDRQQVKNRQRMGFYGANGSHAFGNAVCLRLHGDYFTFFDAVSVAEGQGWGRAENPAGENEQPVLWGIWWAAYSGERETAWYEQSHQCDFGDDLYHW